MAFRVFCSNMLFSYKSILCYGEKFQFSLVLAATFEWVIALLPNIIMWLITHKLLQHSYNMVSSLEVYLYS